MHAATRGCGYPADSSYLATGAAGAATSTPSLLWRRSDSGLRLSQASSRPATRSAHPWRARATNTESEAYLRSGRPRQPGHHWAAGSGSPQRRLRPTVTVRACLQSATLSPLARLRGRLRTASAEANCVGPSNCDGCAYPRPTLSQCVTGLRGQGAHSVGQGLIVTAAPTSGPLLTSS